MRTVNSFKDLQQFGIIPLTGESDKLGLRMLCDVTAQGECLLAELFQLRLQLSAPWNTQTDGQPHVGSIMLTRRMITDIAVLGLLRTGSVEAWVMDTGEVWGISESDLERERKWLDQYCAGPNPNRGMPSYRREEHYCREDRGRNEHLMSGRVE